MLRNSWHFFSIPLISGQHAKLAARWFIVVYINIALINMHFAVDDIDTESFSFHFRICFSTSSLIFDRSRETFQRTLM